LRILTCEWVVPVSSPPIRHGAVAIESGRIVALGPAETIFAATYESLSDGRASPRPPRGRLRALPPRGRIWAKRYFCPPS